MTMTEGGLGTQQTANGQAANSGITLPDGTVITPEEAAQGYMRQRDYTQKTQDVANQRKLAERGLNLLAALDQDPHAAVELISRTYDIQTSKPPAQGGQSGQSDEWGDPITSQDSPEVAALKKEIQSLRGSVGTVAQTQQRAQLMQEIQNAHSKYGDSFDQDVVLRHMQANNLPTVELAYRDLNWEGAYEAQSRIQQEQAEQERILAEKRGMSGVVASGGGVPSGSTSAPEQDYTQGSWRENLAAALSDSMSEMNIENLGDPILLER